MKKIFLSFFTIINILPLSGQEAKMVVAGKPGLSETEIVARRMPDGRSCAAVKIFSDLEGFSYNAYLGVQRLDHKPGQDLVFLDPEERILLVYHTGYDPLKIIFSEIGIRLNERQVWEVKIRGGKVDMVSASFLIEPPDADLAVDRKTMAGGPTFPLKTGKHIIKIEKKDYRTVEDTVDVNLNRVLFKYRLEFKPEMVLVPGGTFEMGDVFNEGHADEKPVHTVTVGSFYMSKYEVTFSEFDAFCEATDREKPGDSGWGRGLRPAINVSWYDAVEFCNWRSIHEGLKPCYKIDKTRKDSNNRGLIDTLAWIVECDFLAKGYRLPTEAEWEYAAREGGKKIRFGNGKDIADPNEINFDGSWAFKVYYSVSGIYR